MPTTAPDFLFNQSSCIVHFITFYKSTSLNQPRVHNMQLNVRIAVVYAIHFCKSSAHAAFAQLRMNHTLASIALFMD